MKVYIQSQDKFPVADWAASAYMGFVENGHEVKLFEDINDIIETIPFNSNNIIVAFIEDTLKYFSSFGLDLSKGINVPPELFGHIKRSYEYSTIGEFKNGVGKQYGLPIFIKPVILKQFMAGVMTKPSSLSFFNEVNDDAPCIISEYMDIVSEYRCYVINGELKGIKHYTGDIRVFPNPQIIDNIIADYSTAPIGYGLDVGITSNNETILIEINDGWSLGNYGLEDRLYSTLLSKRWNEIVTQYKK